MTTEYTKNFRLAIPDFRASPWHGDIQQDLRDIDAVLYNQLILGNIGPWENATVYTQGIIRYDANSDTFWVAVVAHTSATLGTFLEDRVAHPTYWSGLSFGITARGEWQNSTQYDYYDLAYDSDLGIAAFCLTPHVSNPAGTIQDDVDNWVFIIDMPTMGGAAASEVSFNPAGTSLVATDVQAAIAEVDDKVLSADDLSVLLRLAFAANDLLINGAFEVLQEKGGNLLTMTNNSLVYVADQWALSYKHLSGTASIKTQVIGVPGTPPFGKSFPNCLEITSPAAFTVSDNGDFIKVAQPIIGDRWNKQSYGVATAADVTVSFWIYAKVAGTAAFAIKNKDLNRSYVHAYTINAPDTWEFKSFVIPGDQFGSWIGDFQLGASIHHCFGAGSTFQGAGDTWAASNKHATAAITNFFGTNGNYVRITGCSLIPGSRGLDSLGSRLAKRPYRETYEMCQVYLQFFGALAASSDPNLGVNFLPSWTFKRMRAVPAITPNLLAGTGAAFNLAEDSMFQTVKNSVPTQFAPMLDARFGGF